MSGVKRRRWVWILGVGALAFALWFWLLHGPGAPAPPLDDVGRASRAELDRVLREAERGEGR